MKEQQYQSKMIKYLESRGAYVVKIGVASKAGVPDILACYKGFMVGVEMKTPTTRNNVSKLQKYNLGKIKDCGGYSLVAVETSEVDFILDDIDER